jgi:trigger factor
MKVTQEKLPASKISLEIEIPAEMSQKTYEKVVQELSRSVNIPGFRKGKVPRPILLQRLGQTRIKASALEELVQNSLEQALQQEGIKALGNFQLISSFDELVNQFKPGQPITFSASVDVPPEVKLGEYANLTIKAEEVSYDPSQVDKFLEERRVEQATLIPVEGRSAQMGDVAIVDFTGRYAQGEQEGEEPKEIQGAQATDFQMELAEGRFIEDLINGIVGMNAGETKEIPVEFPQDYGREDLAGQPAIFSVNLKELKEKELPTLDDDFAQEVSEMETLNDLRESLETRFRGNAERETATNKEQAILAELVKHVEVDLPETMIEQEVETMLRQSIMQMQQMGMDVNKMLTEDMVRQLQARTRPDAIERLKQSLALEEIAKRESLEVEPEALAAKIQEVSEQLKGQKINHERLREVVSSDLLKEKATKWLEEHAAIELVPAGSLKTEEGQLEEDDEATLEAIAGGDEGTSTQTLEAEVEVIAEGSEASTPTAE